MNQFLSEGPIWFEKHNSVVFGENSSGLDTSATYENVFCLFLFSSKFSSVECFPNALTDLINAQLG